MGKPHDSHAVPLSLVTVGDIHTLLRLHVGVEVVADEVVVATVDQGVDQVDEGLSVAAEGAAFDCLVDSAET